MKKFTFIFILFTNILSSQEILRIDNSTSSISYSGKHFLHSWDAKNENISGLIELKENQISKIGVIAKVADFNAMVERVRAERLEERRKQRMAQRRKEYILAQREEKKKKMEEIRKREEEIEKRRLEKEAEERTKARQGQAGRGGGEVQWQRERGGAGRSGDAFSQVR